MSSLLVLKANKKVESIDDSFKTLDDLLRADGCVELLIKTMESYSHEEKDGHFVKQFTSEEVEEDDMLKRIAMYGSDLVNSDFTFEHHGFNTADEVKFSYPIEGCFIFISTAPLYLKIGSREYKMGSGTLLIRKESKENWSISFRSEIDKITEKLSGLSLYCRATLKNGNPCTYKAKHGKYCGIHRK